MRRHVGQPLAIDESLQSYGDMVRIVETGAAEVVGLKVGRVGGLTVARKIRDLCIEAGRKAIEDAGLAPSDIGMVVLGTVTPDRQVSATACKVAHELGCDDAPAFDMAAGCSGSSGEGMGQRAPASSAANAASAATSRASA